MKKVILLVIVLSQIISPANAQLMKKLNQKINKVTDKALGNDQSEEKKQTDLEKKEDDAQSAYSDVTENNERPIFVEVAPSNGKMMLKLKKSDLFWGGYITITGQPKKDDTNPNVLDYINVRLASMFNAGEMSSYAIYFDGKRVLNDPNIIPLRPEFISYDINKTPYFSSTEATSSGPPDMAAVQAKMQEMQNRGGKPMTKEEEESFQNTFSMKITPPTFTFKYNGKTYGPFNGIGEKMFVLKSMTDGQPTEKFYGFGTESITGDGVLIMNALIQTEKTVLRIKDYVLTTLAPSYPTGYMAFTPGGKVNTFSNGKTVPIIKVAGIENSIYDVIKNGGKFISETYGTDSGKVVCIVREVDKTNQTVQPPVEAMIDYKTVLKYPVEVAKQNLLVSRNPAKSVLYKMHTLYYADGTKETIDNVGDAQLVNFNGKEYIVWFEMKKGTDGHEIYVCQKELK
jgi:hypothetical protein